MRRRACFYWMRCLFLFLFKSIAMAMSYQSIVQFTPCAIDMCGWAGLTRRKSVVPLPQQLCNWLVKKRDRI